MKDYIEKTRPMVTFLLRIFGEDISIAASIHIARAEKNTERLIDLMGIVKGRVEDWIEELKNLED